MSNLEDLDRFSAEVFRRAVDRYLEGNREIPASPGKWARYMRLGWLVANFNDMEVRVLSQMGYLCDLDKFDLRLADRWPKYDPINEGGHR